MSSLSEVSFTGSATPSASVLPIAQEMSTPLEGQSGTESKKFAKSKFAKQKKWKDKQKVGAKKPPTRMDKSSEAGGNKMGPQAGPEDESHLVETIEQDDLDEDLAPSRPSTPDGMRTPEGFRLVKGNMISRMTQKQLDIDYIDMELTPLRRIMGAAK